MRKLKILIVCLVTFYSLSAQSEGDTTVNFEYGKEYFPFNDSRELIFESNVGETQTIVEVNDSLFKVTNISDKFVYSQTFIRKDDGIYLIKTEQDISTFLYSTEVIVTYSKPVLQFPHSLKIGDTWEWSGYQVKNGDTTSISISGEALAEDSVDLPAGKFNTLHIKLFFDEVDGEKTSLDQWFAPGLGAVKTKVVIEGTGIIQFAMSLLGYDEIDSELKEVIYRE